MAQFFPPALAVGSRVWTSRGYRDHGPIEGPKTDICPNMGGTITSMTNVGYSILDSVLFTVTWDNGQVSKHYPRGLFCIGRFSTLTEFENAIKFIGPIELTIGPMGGFRHAILTLEYDGRSETARLDDRTLWDNCLEPLARKHGFDISTTRLPGKPRKQRDGPVG